MNRYVLWAFLLGGCFNPDLSAKPCESNIGCPAGYFCDPSRPRAGANGLCSFGAATVDSGGIPTDLLNTGSDDMGSLIPPPVLTEYMITGANFTLGTSLTDLNNSGDSPAYSRGMINLCVQEKEVTVASYTLCVQAGKCSLPAGTDVRCNYGVTGKENHPINCVEFGQAAAFCDWIGRRLPTESEWEYAANGATTSMGEKYPWVGMGGAFVAAKACFNNNGTCPVGSKTRTYLGAEVAATSPGFYDFAGNVWEWTTSELCNYVSSMPDRTCSSPAKIQRGGSGFDTDGRLLRSTVRLGNAKNAASVSVAYPNSWYQNAGFRCFGDVSGTGTCIK